MTEPITCTPRQVALQFVGTRDFHEGTRRGVLVEELRPHADA